MVGMIERGPNRGAMSRALTADQVRAMRAAHADGVSYAQLGRRFGLTKSAARQVVLGITYGWVGAQETWEPIGDVARRVVEQVRK